MHDALNPITPVDRQSRDTVLKENAYKRVILTTRPDGSRLIRKRYSGHRDEHLEANTRYVADTLALFQQRFSDIVRIPACLDIDVKQHEVTIEYLPSLPNAPVLTKQTFARALPFFERCYTIRDDCGFLRPMSLSVYYTPLMRSLIDSGIPLALGLKGDLWQNLCLDERSLILADIDSAALEPLGLSELVMIAEIAASLRRENFGFFGVELAPACFRHLTRHEAEAIIESALEIFNLRLAAAMPGFRYAKRRIARIILEHALDRHYPQATT